MKWIMSLKQQRGYLTLVTVVLIVIVGFLAAALAYITVGSSFGSANLQQATSALYLAESGLEHATHELLFYTLTNRSACSGLSLSNASIGGGTYTVTSTGPFYVSSPTTLNGALTAAATTIPVSSTTNYQSSGRIMVDQEIINYAAINSTNFLFVQRGIDGTTATTHVTGTPVAQFQCQLLSSGGIPGLTFSSGAPGGKRVLNEAVQLQEAWAVGNTTGGNFSLMRWNRPTEIVWNNGSSAGAFSLNGVSMISNVDGWAAGASTTFLHWNGSTWSTVATGLANVTYNDIFCLSKNNCHVAGNAGVSINVPTIADWNGTTWTATALNVGSIAGSQVSVHCSTATDCWSVGAVGQNKNNSHFYHWNGATWSSSLLSGVNTTDFPYNGVFCTSTSNCWAVGASANFGHWTGAASWAIVATGMPTVQYNGIYCSTASDCWVVGNVNAANDTILHWNGTAWSRDTSNPTPAVNLNSVACYDSNDCWAVGAASGSHPVFVHWNGSNWSTFSTSSLPNVTANFVSVIGPKTQPWSAWSEDFF